MKQARSKQLVQSLYSVAKKVAHFNFEMDVSSVSEIWNALKTKNSHFGNQRILECEPEIQELLQCVDSYVQNQQKGWDNERQGLLAKLAIIPEQECLMQKTTIDQKNREIGKLRSAVESLKKQHQEAVDTYEKELVAVKNEAACLRRDHDKLLQKHEQHLGIVSSEKFQHDQDEIKCKKLSRKLEDYRQYSLEWEHEKRVLQRQLENLHSENKILTEKNENMSKQLYNGADVELEQLQDQLAKAQDSITSQDKTITRMKVMLEESMMAQKQALHEKEQLEGELRSLHQIMRKFEEESDNHIAMETHRQVIGSSQAEHVELNHQVTELEQLLNEKENIIQNLKASEKHLTEEMAQTREQLSLHILECDHLSCQLQKKTSEQQNAELTIMKQLRNENYKLQKDFQSIKDSFQFEVNAFKKKESKLNSDIEHQSATVMDLNRKLALLEKQERQYISMLNQYKAESEVTKAELHAVKLENRHRCCGTLLRNGGNLLEADKTKSDCHIIEIQNAYAESVKTLQYQNDLLEKDLSFVKSELQKMEENAESKIHVALLDKEKNNRQMKDAEKRNMFELSELNKRQMQTTEAQFHETIEQFEAKIEELQNRIFCLEDELRLKNASLAKFCQQNGVVPDFTNGVNHISCPTVQNISVGEAEEFNHNGNTSPKVLSSEITDIFYDYDLTIDSTENATEEFQRLHEANNQQLEKKLNFLIEEIQALTDNTIKKAALLNICS